MCACMYVTVCVCVCVCVCARACLRACVRACVRRCMCVYMCVCTRMYMYTCCACVRTCMHVKEAFPIIEPPIRSHTEERALGICSHNLNSTHNSSILLEVDVNINRDQSCVSLHGASYVIRKYTRTAVVSLKWLHKCFMIMRVRVMRLEHYGNCALCEFSIVEFSIMRIQQCANLALCELTL